MAEVKKRKTPNRVGFTSPHSEGISQNEANLFTELQEAAINIHSQLDSLNANFEQYDDTEIREEIKTLRRQVLGYTQHYLSLGFRAP